MTTASAQIDKRATFFAQKKSTINNSTIGNKLVFSRFYFQVKIWFQNRRMKWKRSKKAQQESKMKDSDSLNSEKRQSKPCVSQEIVTSSPAIQMPVESSQTSSRKLQEGESLYRPYVV